MDSSIWEDRETLETSTHHPDGDTAEVLQGHLGLLDLGGQTLLLQELQQSLGVSRRPLRRRRRDPVRLQEQRVSSAVGLRGNQQLADGRFEVLLVVLVPVERLPQLRRDIFCSGTETPVKVSPGVRGNRKKNEKRSSAPCWFIGTNHLEMKQSVSDSHIS